MRAGKLDREITIERSSQTIDGNGAAVDAWTSLVTLRAQVLQQSTEEFIRAYGASTEAVIVFRVRFIDGVMLADRVVYAGDRFNIKGLKEIGRRRGLEIRAEKIGL